MESTSLECVLFCDLQQMWMKQNITKHVLSYEKNIFIKICYNFLLITFLILFIDYIR